MRILMIGLIVLLPGAAAAERDEVLRFVDGNELLQLCDTVLDRNIGSCRGYVMGVFYDMLLTARVTDLEDICSLRGVTDSDAVDAVHQWLLANPEKRNSPVAEVIREAIYDAFGAC